jgi:uncharacterized repeat protein (TIGR03803 family)
MNAMKSHTSEGVISGLCWTGSVTRQPLVGGLLVLVCAALLLVGSARAAAAERQKLHGNVPASIGHLRALERLAGTNRLDLVIVLPLRNREALASLLGQLYDPASPDHHQYLTPGQFAERFGPTRQDYGAVIAFAKANGLRVTRTHPNRTLVDVSGAVTDIERTFQVKIHVYQHPTEGRTFYAPDAEPSLDLAVPVLAVSGLDNFAVPRPASQSAFSFRKISEVAPNAKPFATGGGPRGTFMGRDFRAAYAPGVALDGTGQAVGLLEFDGYYANDILAYENLAGLPNVPLTNMLVNGFDGSLGGNNVEVALDIEMAISMAPGLAKVIVYEAESGSNPYDLLNRMATDTNSFGQPVARQLSSSWSWPGFPTAGQDQIFQQFAVQGQSFFQASGDYGAYCGACSPDPPIESTNITVVGGTSLTTSEPGGAWLSETVWNAGRQPNGTYAGSGGGSSTNYAIPIWQQGVDMTCNGGSTALRNLPDVSCVADGIWVIVNNGEQVVIGGTSAAAPLWAGFAALVNQQAAASGKPSVGLINPAIYAIGKSSRYASAFHDITTGNTTNACCSPNQFFACPGYDLCTGWGTPAGSNLISALLAPPVPLRVTPATLPTFTGPLGGPFRPPVQGFVLTNDSNAPLSWTVANAAPWLNVSPAGGTLTNGGPATTVAVTLTSAASSLPVGSYAATLWFTNVNLTNLNDQLGQSRQVNLDIVAPPVITLQPANQVVLPGMTANFTVGVANSASLSYQWQYDNGMYMTNLTDGANVSGSGASTLVISNSTSADEGAYSVVVSNAAGAVASTEAFLGIVPWRPTITSQPSSQTVLAGEPVTFTVAAVGNQPLFYLWQRSGTNLSEGGNISGSASSSLTLRSASLADAGIYSVAVGNNDGLAVSFGAVLTVTAVTAPGATLGTVYSFTGGNDGANPNALLRVANGSFYGTTQNGGTNLAGTVFQMTEGGAVMGLYSFTGGNDGATPFAALAQGPDGNFYGTTFQGGAYDNGTVFRVTASGVLSNLISLNITNGDLPYAGLALGSDLNFYGTTYQGGAAGRGTAFRISTNGTLTTLYSFSNGLDGGHVAAGLAPGSDGNFYGTSYKGGASGYGTVFQITPNGALTTLASFNNTNGAYPLAELVQDVGGSFYGTTTSGGAYNNGVVFRMTPAGVLTNLYSFGGGTDGSYPAAALLQGSDGNFYGTTAYGGAYGDGTVFRMTPDGTVTTLVAFDDYAGANPQAALIEDADGSLLGTTQNGGASDEGVIFRLTFSGPPQITGQPASQSVYAGDNVILSVAVSGASPFAYQWHKNGTNLVDGGNLSGSTSRVLSFAGVATNNAGTYSVLVSNPAGSTNSASALLQVVSSPPVIVMAPTNQAPNACTSVSFDVAAAGNQPLSYQWQKNGVNLADACNIFGSATNTLVISNVTEADNGTYTIIVSNALGSTNASASLTVVPNSAPCTSLTTWHWFSGGTDGRNANALALGTNGDLYGTTYSGGTHPWGTVFSLTTNGAFATLVSFMETNGANPAAAPVQGADGKFYGTTFYGGAFGAGTVYSMTADGALSTVYSFTGEGDGANPSGVLVQGADGGFYGATTGGGLFAYGTVFRVAPDGTLTNLHSFNGADGMFPTGGLAQGYDGSLYGLTTEGGANDKGAVFRITPAGAFTLLYSFTGASDGYSPAGALVRGPDCNFYGVTKHSVLGRIELFGTVFKITPNGALTTLHSFGDLVLKDGLYPYAGLMQSMDGNLYGTTYTDHMGGSGTVFRISPDGSSFATLVYFDGCDDGAHPEAALVEDAAGNLYGTTTAGGPCQAGQGTLFRLSVGCAPQVTASPASQAVVGGANVVLSVAVSGARPFWYQWQRNGTNLVDGGNLAGSTNRNLTLANVSLADSGTYSVSVSNALGSATSAGAHLTVVYPPVFLSTVESNCTLTFTWSAMAGQQYRLQYKPALAASNWTYLGNILTANGSVLAASDNVCTNAQRFYRVVMFPQIQ